MPLEQPTRIGLTELETFLAVVDLGSFSLAAQKMHVSQPSVTARVQRLEDCLHTKLLTRTTRKLEPTPAGLRLHKTANSTLQELRALIHEFQAAAQEERNRVVVAATPMIAALTLPGIIHAYRRRYPDVEIVLRDMQYEEVLESLDASSVDLGIVAFDGDPNSNKYRFQLLTDEEMLLVVPEGHPLSDFTEVTLAQLARYPLLILDRYQALWEPIAATLKEKGLEPTSVGGGVHLSTILGMVDAGNGITILPRPMAYSHAKRHRAVLRVTDLKLKRSYGILRLRKGDFGVAASSFCMFLEREFAATLAAGNSVAQDLASSQ